MARITKVCGHCGSKEVVVDAWVHWDEEAQDWELDAIHFRLPQSYYCQGCEQTTTIKDKEV